jgi:hypothetical protein
MAVRSAAGGRKHPVFASRKPACLLVSGEQPCELGDERDVADRGRGLRGYAPRGRPAVGARQLRAHVDDAGVEVDVVPDEAEQLGDPQARVEHGRDHQPVAWRADREQALDLGAAEHALAATLGPRALVVLEPLDRVGDDPAAAAGEAHDALERPERARRGLRRAALAAQSMH